MKYMVVSWCLCCLYGHPRVVELIVPQIVNVLDLQKLQFTPLNTLWCCRNREIAEYIISSIPGLKFELFERTIPKIIKTETDDKIWLIDLCLEYGAEVSINMIRNALYSENRDSLAIMYDERYYKDILFLAAQEDIHTVVSRLLDYNKRTKMIFDDDIIYEACYRAMTFWRWQLFKLIRENLCDQSQTRIDREMKYRGYDKDMERE